MRSLRDGWYRTSAEGPMVRHVPGVVTDTAWDPRMEALMPLTRLEGGKGFAPVYDTDERGKDLRKPAPEWESEDDGQTYVEVFEGKPIHVQFSGTGLILGGKVRLAAEVLLEAWLEIPTDRVQQPAPNGVPIPCWLSPEQPSHRVLWSPYGGRATATPIRVEGDKGYSHVEWAFRAHPRCHPNWAYFNGKWWWRSPEGKLYPAPANKNGALRIEAV